MKKLVLAGVLSLLVLTGCGKKETVVCTMDKEMNGIKVNSTINTLIEGNKFKNMNAEYEIIIPESALSRKNEVVSKLEKQYKEYGEKIGTTIETTETDNGAKVKLEMTAEQAKKFSGSNNDRATRKDVIELFGKQGFECK